MGHAKFSPSASSRWLACTACIDMEAGMPVRDDTTRPAALGTCYHAVADDALTTIVDMHETPPSEKQVRVHLGVSMERVMAEPLKYMGERDAPYAEGMDEDALEAKVFPYVWALLEQHEARYFGDDELDLFGFETHVLMHHLGGQCSGTVDAWAYDPDEWVLDVHDLKTGEYPVSPDNNPQMLLYALGVAVHLGLEDDQRPCNTIRLHIHQGGRDKVWECTWDDDLTAFELRAMQAIKAARVGGELKAGEHCRWCAAITACGAYAERGLTTAQEEFALAPIEDEESTLLTLDTMTGKDAARLLDRFAEIEHMVKVAREVFTERVIRGDLQMPGYKLIRGAKHKQWTEDSVAEVEAIVGKRKAYKRTLHTPAQALKLVKGNKGKEVALGGLITTPEGDLKVVTELSRGKAITPASLDFTDGQGNEDT